MGFLKQLWKEVRKRARGVAGFGKGYRLNGGVILVRQSFKVVIRG